MNASVKRFSRRQQKQQTKQTTKMPLQQRLNAANQNRRSPASPANPVAPPLRFVATELTVAASSNKPLRQNATTGCFFLFLPLSEKETKHFLSCKGYPGISPASPLGPLGEPCMQSWPAPPPGIGEVCHTIAPAPPRGALADGCCCSRQPSSGDVGKTEAPAQHPPTQASQTDLDRPHSSHAPVH